jgi:hypothetical protein
MPVGCYVQWSDDAAWSDEGEGVDLEVCPQGEYVARLDGWMSGYKSELEACESDDED